MSFLVRDLAEGGSYEEHHGDLALGGVLWRGRHPPVGRNVEIRFRLPGVAPELRLKAEIIRLSERGRDIGCHGRFIELPLEDERALARYLDGLGERGR